MKVLIPSTLALLVVLSMSQVAFASSPVPFNGSSSGTFAFTSPTTALLTATGDYSHLGDTMFAGTSTITGGAACGGFAAVEQDTYTASNGDKLLLSVTDTLCPTSNPNVLQLTGTFIVSGGDGRFSDASGSGTIQASVTFTSPTSGTFLGTTAGTISY